MGVFNRVVLPPDITIVQQSHLLVHVGVGQDVISVYDLFPTLPW